MKVLIVEDDALMGNLLLDVLNRANFSPTLAKDAPEALQYLTENTPDIILLDIILPGINGFDFLQRIKQQDATKKIPVLILSNLGDKTDIEKGKKLGATDYFVKANITPREIVQKIKDVIGRQ